MKGLVKLAIVTGLGIFAVKGWKDWMGSRDTNTEEAGPIRDAGPQEGIAAGDWDVVDQQSDESFPASDPPANY